MKPCICKTLISLSLKNSQHLHKPPFVYSISVLFSSSPKKENTKISLAEYLSNQHNFSPEAALEASSIRCYLKNPENSDSVLSFLRENGFDKSHIEKMVARRPNILYANLDTNIKPKIKMFQEFGFASSDIADIISVDPWILQRSADNQLRQSLLVLKSILGSSADVSKAIKISGWFLKCDLQKTMIPNIEFLKSCGINSAQIVKYVFNFPRFFLHKPETIRCFVQRVDDMGFDRKSKMFLSAIRTISSMSTETWERKLKLVRNLGFSDGDILGMFKSMPQAFAMSERKIQEVTEMLLNRGDMDISFIVNNPSLLLCSIEGSLKPRLKVYDILKSKNLLPKRTGLVTICKISRSRFIDKFVLPYQDELGELSFLAKARGQ